MRFLNMLGVIKLLKSEIPNGGFIRRKKLEGLLSECNRILIDTRARKITMQQARDRRNGVVLELIDMDLCEFGDLDRYVLPNRVINEYDP